MAVSTLLAPGVAISQLPDPGLVIDQERTAVVITDPQNDFLSPEGVTWGLVGKSVEANNTVANIEALMKTAKSRTVSLYSSRLITTIPPTMDGSLEGRWKP